MWCGVGVLTKQCKVTAPAEQPAAARRELAAAAAAVERKHKPAAAAKQRKVESRATRESNLPRTAGAHGGCSVEGCATQAREQHARWPAHSKLCRRHLNFMPTTYKCDICNKKEKWHTWYDGWEGPCYEGKCESCHQALLGGVVMVDEGGAVILYRHLLLLVYILEILCMQQSEMRRNELMKVSPSSMIGRACAGKRVYASHVHMRRLQQKGEVAHMV
jgi:hypothetical protein